MGTNITLAVDEKMVERARQVARQQGTSLNALIREYIERLAGERSGAQVVADLKRMWKQGGGRSGGRKFKRDELYEDRIGRSRLR
jgi:hypothetical protein